MGINPIQANIDNTKTHTPYKDAQGAVSTAENVKPLAPQGHLVHDTIVSVPKYFVKDIAYDMKAVKDGFQGNANDHQSGRLNDVGLKLGGIGIATILAAKTTNPVARIMEYAGLGAFLASMSLYPKLAINAPSRIVQGFDIGKEYIDDQGRKKSVYQDPNYIPYDMYLGEYPGEDLDIIGDRMGIPRDIKNRQDLIKEQTRKIAIQNNTLWMLTAGVAAPVMSALLCCGLEKAIAPGVETIRNANYNSKITHLLNKTQNMTEHPSEIAPNNLSRSVEKILAGYKGQELPKAEYEKLVSVLTKEMDSIAAEGVKADLAAILGQGQNGSKLFALNENSAEEIVRTIKNNIATRNKSTMEKVFVPTANEVQNILDKVGTKQINEDQLLSLKNEFRKHFAEKIQNETTISKEALKAYENEILEAISKQIQGNKSNLVDDAKINDLKDFAKVLGEFKQNGKALDKCKSFKVEYTHQTVLARSYEKFQNTLFEVLGIKYKDLNKMRSSEKMAQEILENKISELVKDDAKYTKAIEKLTKVMSEMEIKLNGRSNDEAYLKDLITGIENNYNKTAKRLEKLGKFNNTIDALVKEDPKTLSNTINSRQELFDFLDGVKKSQYAGVNYWGEGMDDAKRLEYVKYNAKGAGSAKNHDIARIVDRYQGVKNSFNRILHLLDVSKRPEAGGAYNQEVIKQGREAIIKATSSDHVLKLGTDNNPELYKEIMYKIWGGNIQQETQKGLELSKDIASGDVSGRFSKYLQRFRDIIGNNNIDFTKPYHILEADKPKGYIKSSNTRLSKFNLVAQTPVDMVKKAAEMKYGNQKWLRIVSIVGATVFSSAVAAQFCFGKIRNPHNIIRQVIDDASNKDKSV